MLNKMCAPGRGHAVQSKHSWQGDTIMYIMYIIYLMYYKDRRKGYIVCIPDWGHAVHSK